MPPLQFQPLSSQPTPAFWSALTELKLDKFKLDETQQPIIGWLEEGKTVSDREALSTSSQEDAQIGIDGSVGVGGDAFGMSDGMSPPSTIPVTGIVKIFNTIEHFRKNDVKKKLFDDMVETILESFASDQPNLNPFLLVTFADLKKYVFHYWFAFPALAAKPAWEIGPEGLTHMADEDIAEIRTLEDDMSKKSGLKHTAYLVYGARGQRTVAPISDCERIYERINHNEVFVAFHDPSSSKHHPGWPLRNILFYLKTKHSIRDVQVICLRAGLASRQCRITSPEGNQHHPDLSDKLQAVGWERDSFGKLASRQADLGPIMNPARLAEQAVDLNLKLMKWRIMPSLDLEKIASTKCLLLGAGTLGCYVARNLMGWGVRNITFVDSGRVSYSNPVRQPLFDFDDCLDGGKPKAQCAAERLRRIFPGANAKGHSFTIPMPGHPVALSSEQTVASNIRCLEDLIRSHDAVFLLMDSRESRWLPTVIGAAESKIVINAALGFDTYLVMRHGVERIDMGSKELGCYYCNDIVAPTDSLTDRTLDQMCTVTRPGMAPIAAASAVELMVSLVQHPLGPAAPADVLGSAKNYSYDAVSGSPLGIIPHQLRGSLSNWGTLLIKGAAYDRCTGCSHHIIEAYRSGGFTFFLKAFNEIDYLETLTGLDLLHAAGEAVMDQVDWDDSGEDE
ncbi:E1-like protein-activating enzyme Gsa7p/Apg7p [Kwoniella newhampshirensis]|uniref:Ubiquitin-like modifier-activating enzyme ATG7 n=1 Tax=Kwoniella newhampshirensis TaxID=1651941 RepID=A0AAW0YVF9_9TREE